MRMLWLVSNVVCQNNCCCNLILTLGQAELPPVVCAVFVRLCAGGKLRKVCWLLVYAKLADFPQAKRIFTLNRLL